MERIVDEDSLGRERCEWATPGSALAAALAETDLPDEPGFYVDPLSDGSKARKFNGIDWTGLTREIPPEKVTHVKKPHATLTGVQASFNCVLLSIVGLQVGAHEGDKLELIFTDTQVVLMKIVSVKEEYRVATFDRASIRAIEVTGGDRHQTGGGFIGGGFGLEGAATGIVISTILNTLTTRTRVEPAIAEIVTSWGHVVVANTDLGVLQLKGILAPFAPDPHDPKSVAQAPDDVTLLERLAALHRNGDLTDEEFTSKKREILGRI